MKSRFIVLFCCLSLYGNAQNKLNRNNISFGPGTQSYKGDLGNTWFVLEEEWHGMIAVNYSRYMNRSIDLSFSLTSGSYGHCREADEEQYRPDGSEVLNMLTQLTTGIVSVKYKFSNGYLLSDSSRIKPFIFAGAGINNVSEIFWENKTRGRAGNYASLNGGAGLSYQISKKLNLSYQIGFGQLLSDNVDYRKEGGGDQYMQNTFSVGFTY